MSGVGEVVGIVACLARVISAYHDGAAFIQRIKIKRAEKCAPPPPRLLEESIDQAPEEIEKEKRRGITRFGEAFEAGDATAVLALQQITIELQNSLFVKLRDAAHDDEVVDLTSLIDAADLGRDRTIGVLLELKQRLLQAAPITQSSTSEEYATLLGSESGQSRRHRPSSLFGKFRQHRIDNGLNDRKSDESERYQSTTTQPFPPLNSWPEEPTRPFFTFEEGNDIPFRSWGGQVQESRRSNTLSTSPRTLRSSTAHSSTTAMRQLSNVPSGDSQSSASPLSLQPNPDNNYLGFCKGAARLQNGDRTAMQKTKEFNDGWSQSNVYYLSCSNSKCAFAGHMDLDVIWTKVWNLGEDKGLKFRWPLLAKSHVCQNKAKNNQFAYQCLFCAFLGYQLPVIHGTDLYLEHLSQEHRGRKLSDVVLYRTHGVNDRVCEDSEEFDINLFPLTDSEAARLREQSEVLSDDLMMGPRKPGSDAQDSVFSNEPWNEGLSEFHYTDEYEYGDAMSLRSFRSNGMG